MIRLKENYWEGPCLSASTRDLYGRFEFRGGFSSDSCALALRFRFRLPRTSMRLPTTECNTKTPSLKPALRRVAFLQREELIAGLRLVVLVSRLPGYRHAASVHRIIAQGAGPAASDFSHFTDA